METVKKPRYILLWISLFLIYIFILFIYQMSFNERTTIIFTVMYAVCTILVLVFAHGLKNKKNRYLYTGAILSICLNFVVIVAGIMYFNNLKHEDFQRKQILLTGASNAYEALNLDSKKIISVEVGEYTKRDGFPFQYKVKITTSESDQPLYFECSNYECTTMIKVPVTQNILNFKRQQ